jgi:hypothetical protein
MMLRHWKQLRIAEPDRRFQVHCVAIRSLVSFVPNVIVVEEAQDQPVQLVRVQGQVRERDLQDRLDPQEHQEHLEQQREPVLPVQREQLDQLEHQEHPEQQREPVPLDQLVEQV